MTMRVNGNNAVAWRRFDSEAVRNTAGGIHHGESAIQNVRAIGEDALHAAIPVDRALTLAGYFGAFGNVGLGIAGFFLGLLWDIGEILAFPFTLLWNTINIIGHGGAAAVNAANGESDGEVDSDDVADYSFFSQGSAERIVQQTDRSGGSLAYAGLTAPSSTGVSIARGSSSSSSS